MTHKILGFSTLDNEGKHTYRRIVRNIHNQFILLNSNLKTIYIEDNMLKHKKNYAITSIILGATVVTIGNNAIFEGGDSVETIDHDASVSNNFEISMITVRSNHGKEIKMIIDKGESKSNKALSYLTFEDNEPIKQKAYKALAPKKDIREEKCLSINEIENILGGLEDCGKLLIDYVKKKLNKNGKSI